MQEVFSHITDFSKADKKGFALPTAFLTASNQPKEMNILLKHDLCKISDCDEILKVAKMNDNKEIIAIIDNNR
jgi:hypothetical protein